MSSAVETSVIGISPFASLSRNDSDSVDVRNDNVSVNIRNDSADIRNVSEDLREHSVYINRFN